MTKKIMAFAIIILIILAAAVLWRQFRLSPPPTAIQPKTSETKTDTNGNTSANPATASASPAAPPPSVALSAVVTPLSDAAKRITKKFFGTYVTPQNSPVNPERFKGYHTGLDFETFAEEQNPDVSVKAICTGALVTKGRASGYGGYAVQSCTISGQTVTVLYGHLRQSSISASAGTTLQAGEQLGVLGTGYSSETDGERKHLHLGIHKGPAVNIKGYVQTKNELSAWMDPKPLLGL